MWLRATPSLDIESPAILEAAARITAGAGDDTERAVRIHDFVRDQILFGSVPNFDADSASQTLAARVGFCNTKTPFFVALRRAVKIPARLHFAGINKEILKGLIDPVDKYVDHSYAEVLLQGRWLKVDSYIVDLPLYQAAMRKLRVSGRLIGFGVHTNGTASWDGRSDCFAQFVNESAAPRSAMLIWSL